MLITISAREYDMDIKRAQCDFILFYLEKFRLIPNIFLKQEKEDTFIFLENSLRFQS